MTDILYVIIAVLVVVIIVIGIRLSKYNKFISNQEAAKVIVADFLTRFSAWVHEPNHCANWSTKEYQKKYNTFYAQAERFEVESTGMVMSQQWCDDLAKKFGVKEINL